MYIVMREAREGGKILGVMQKPRGSLISARVEVDDGLMAYGRRRCCSSARTHLLA
jgi:hypothetical protein